MCNHESEMLLLYYNEAGSRRVELEEHRAQCRQCGTFYGELGSLLGLVTAPALLQLAKPPQVRSQTTVGWWHQATSWLHFSSDQWVVSTTGVLATLLLLLRLGGGVFVPVFSGGIALAPAQLSLSWERARDELAYAIGEYEEDELHTDFDLEFAALEVELEILEGGAY